MSSVCHNHKPQPTLDTKRTRKRTKTYTRKTNKQMYEKHKDQLPLPCHQNLILSTLLYIIVHFRNRRKENSSKIPAHGIYRSVKLFLQPIKLHEISILMRNWNYRKGTKQYRYILSKSHRTGIYTVPIQLAIAGSRPGADWRPALSKPYRSCLSCQ